MYYKDENSVLYENPIVANHVGLIEITKEEFDALAYPAPTPEELQAQAITHYKSLYLAIINAKLKELDYDSLATVKLWEGDAVFGVEATRILNWYKAIINKNYQLLNAGTPLTDEQYLAEINSIVF